jgi:hypothetical protein
MTPFIVETAAGLLVAAIVATFGYASGKRAVQRKINDASVLYMLKLEELIRNSVKDGEYKAVANASQIVAGCEAFRGPLEGIRRELNSEIDTLAKLVRQGSDSRREIFATIGALQLSWPGKRRAVESETRKLLTLLGVE